ncbi:YutD family protein [Paenibacillus sp. LHD-117]|uniref:YutD family protein n=1 Tax=Paenibacillus sp. LHD-117 TaxID=3071412 RepID=UPI0027E20ECB|nr:YutD family protein [Paenibacillus sp. LHD-117]MDQ6420309.1 YutD family protein [Paenibacillus sp. LHD-117]
MIHIGGKSYELMHENRNGWNPEAFRNRYSEVLERYDYIIGDWGYNQLRLKGFFRDGHQKASKESNFSSVSDYINEYCNFGCAYFILEKKQNANREPDEDDLDLNYEPDAPRLEGYDLRAAAESAATAISAELEQVEESVRPAPSRRDSHSGGRHRHNHGHNSHKDHGGNNQQGNPSKQEGQGRSAEGGEGKRRDQPYRKNNRNRHHDHRAKKPMKIAASESAAASEGQNHKSQQQQQ